MLKKRGSHIENYPKGENQEQKKKSSQSNTKPGLHNI
jgi:hypothetical protein